ncbi:uncharacterized protein BDR25DRAFT_301085 [Lindgomyces ingoldianus]|uniref:Uncharacterized protein n=1 Tax=Lindgomyces ingoldianus TaxID=673940 RepID=A0ACB6R8M4_9PLEO|nr:uncharacterized protein BDR25DRAFT_301085 [Lindgomyces ingoldianus]KAF2475395.1 hypothetical protein BDR25DRAFT_301085 [Lindgomyces ingoldianus]
MASSSYGLRSQSGGRRKSYEDYAGFQGIDLANDQDSSYDSHESTRGGTPRSTASVCSLPLGSRADVNIHNDGEDGDGGYSLSLSPLKQPWDFTLPVIQYRAFRNHPIHLYHFNTVLLSFRDLKNSFTSHELGWQHSLTGLDPGRDWRIPDGDEIPFGCIEVGYLSNVFRATEKAPKSKAARLRGCAIGFRLQEARGEGCVIGCPIAGIEWFCFRRPMKEMLEQMTGMGGRKVFNLVAHIEKGSMDWSNEHREWYESMVGGVYKPMKLRLKCGRCARNELQAANAVKIEGDENGGQETRQGDTKLKLRIRLGRSSRDHSISVATGETEDQYDEGEGGNELEEDYASKAQEHGEENELDEAEEDSEEDEQDQEPDESKEGQEEADDQIPTAANTNHRLMTPASLDGRVSTSTACRMNRITERWY